MPLMNINAGAAGNPLDALLNGRSMWGNAGGMLYTDPSYSGANGQAANLGNYSQATDEAGNPMGQDGVLTTDPRYFVRSSSAGSEGGGGDSVYTLNPQTQAALGGRVQIKNTNIGGPGGVIDPSKVTYDPEFGMITDPSNLNPVGETFLDQYGPWLMAAVAGVGAASAAGAFGAAGTEGGVGAAGSATGPGAFDIGGSTGFGGSTALSGGGAAGTGTGALDFGSFGGLDPETASGQFGGMGNLADGGTYAGPPISSGSSSFLSNLNTGRQYFNGARSVMNLLSGGQGGQRSGGSMGSSDFGSFLSSLLGGSGGGALGGILGLLANGHAMYGGGVGTAAGAQAAADKGSALADPWGASGQRAQFSNLLTPDRVMGLLSQDPSQVLNNPAYQFDLQQGTNAINMGDAAQGTLRSGNRGYELQNYGQGLASKYGQQFINNNMATLNALSGLAGVNAGSPTAAGQIQMNGFDNASNIRNAGTNGLFSGGSSNPLFGGTSGSSPIMSLLSQIFSGNGSGGFDMSSVDFGSLPDFNDTSGFNPSDYFDFGASADAGNSLVDATGAFF